MAAKKNYSRYFIILQEDEKGFSLERDKSPSGYVKLEKKNNKCKVSYYAQNLNQEKQPYHLVLICDDKKGKGIVNISKATLDENSKIDTCKEYDANNIADMQMDMDKILGAAIVKMIDDSIISIMSGFVSQDQNDGWKTYPIMNLRDEEAREEKEVFEEYERKIEEEKVDIEDENDDFIEAGEEETRHKNKKKEKCDKLEDKIEDYKEKSEEYKEKSEEYHEKYEEYKEKYEEYEDKYEDKCKDDCCEDKCCKMSEEDYPIGMVGDFFKSLVEEFHKEKDLTKELKHCKWYNVAINNIEELYDMSDYDRYTVVYYPMLVYYAYIQKHKHFCLGFKCNDMGKLQYLIYAVPGDKTKEDQPFGGKTGFVTWVSCEEKSNKGYWLMFYDIRNSSVVVPVKKK